MLAALEKELLARWPELKEGGETPSGLRFLLSAKAAKLRFFIFPEGRSSPVLFAKTVRSQVDSRLVAREFEILDQMYRLADERQRQLLPPRPLLYQGGGRPWLVYPWLDGGPVESGPGAFAEVMSLGTEIAKVLAGKQAFVEPGQPSLMSWARECLKQWCELDGLRDDPEFKAMIVLVERALSADPCLPRVPLVLTHGDFAATNFFRRADGRVVLLDWEFSPVLGPPFYDLALLAFHYLFYLWAHRWRSDDRLGDMRRLLHKLLCEEGEISRGVIGAFVRYGTALDLPVHIAAYSLGLVLLRITCLMARKEWGQAGATEIRCACKEFWANFEAYRLAIEKRADSLKRESERDCEFWRCVEETYWFRKGGLGFRDSRKLCMEPMERGRAYCRQIERVRGLKGAAVLDLGCRAGGVALALEERGASVTTTQPEGVDYELVRVRLKAHASRVVLDCCGAEDLKYPPGTFDVVVCTEVIEHVPNRRRALAEIVRVIKPGGYLYLAVPNRYAIRRLGASPEDGIALLSLVRRCLRRSYAICFRGGASHTVAGRGPSLRWIRGQLKSWGMRPVRLLSQEEFRVVSRILRPGRIHNREVRRIFRWIALAGLSRAVAAGYLALIPPVHTILARKGARKG